MATNFTEKVFEEAVKDSNYIFYMIYFNKTAVGYSKIIYNYQNQYRFTTNIPINFQHDILGKYFQNIKDKPIIIKKIKDKDIIKIPTSKLIKKKHR